MKAKKFIVSALASASVIGAIGIAYAQSTTPAPSAPAGSSATSSMPSNTPSSDAARTDTSGMNNGTAANVQNDTAEPKAQADRG